MLFFDPRSLFWKENGGGGVLVLVCSSRLAGKLFSVLVKSNHTKPSSSIPVYFSVKYFSITIAAAPREMASSLK